MTASQVFIFSLSLGALGITLLASALLWRVWRMQKAGTRMEEALRSYTAERTVVDTAVPNGALWGTPVVPATQGGQEELSGLPKLQSPWLQTGWARALLPDEDRELLGQAGISMQGEGAVVYVVSRVVLAVLLPLLVLNVADLSGGRAWGAAFFGFGIGVMLPKWVVRSKAVKRCKQVGEELPLFVDMLRLLQGVGLSIDQSLHILATEFSRVLPVTSAELVLANQLYATGRSREQAFQRLIGLSGDDDMVSVVNLLVQVDKHGGAVQEPLSQFAQRLREKRQASFKEKIGTITVKMTGVMVLTLLPALIVITAGPGFTAVMRTLAGTR